MNAIFDSPQAACNAMNVLLDKPVPLPGMRVRLMHKDSRTHDRAVFMNSYTENFGCLYSFRTKQKFFWNIKKKDSKHSEEHRTVVPRKSNYELMKKLMKVASPIKSYPYLERKHLTEYKRYPLFELDCKYVEKLYNKKFMMNFRGEKFILVPMQDKYGKIQTAQLINETGIKRFLRGSTKNYFFSTEDLIDAKVIGIAEGVATALSIAQVEGFPVVATMSCSQFCNIVPIIKKDHPKAKLIVLSDVGNGEQEAKRVALENSIRSVSPRFTKEDIEDFESKTNQIPTDFNDYYILNGDL